MTDKNHIHRLKKIVQDLRDPDTGCSWDIKQTHASVMPCAIEEVYEVADAVERNDMVDLRDELGDMLLQVIFHSQIAQENGDFTFDDVVQGICDKMTRRHPHVFGDVEKYGNLTDVEIKANWQRIKNEEKKSKIAEKQDKNINYDEKKAQNAPISNDISPPSAPALMRGQKISKKAVSYGFEWSDVQGIYDKINEELNEVKQAENQEERTLEIGDVLFSVLNLARHYDIDAEQALNKTNHKFVKRFNSMMADLQAQNPTLSTPYDVDLMERYWQIAKKKD